MVTRWGEMLIEEDPVVAVMLRGRKRASVMARGWERSKWERVLNSNSNSFTDKRPGRNNDVCIASVCARACVCRSLWELARAFHRIFRLLRPLDRSAVGHARRGMVGQRGEKERQRDEGRPARGKWRVIAASCYRVLHLRRCFWCIASVRATCMYVPAP